MKLKSEEQRIKELMDSLKNHEMYQKLFEEIDRDIRRSMEREKKKVKLKPKTDWFFLQVTLS